MKRAGLVFAFWAALSLAAIAQVGGLSFPGPGPIVSSGGGPALSIDGSGATGAVNTAKTSVTATITTANANDIILACAINTGLTTTAPTITSVAGSGGTGTIGSFTLRSQVTGVVTTTRSGRLSYWWASASTALASKVITATASGANDTMSLIVIAVTGAGSQTTPFDSNISLPPTGGFGTGTAAIVQTTGISTTHANDMLVSCASIFGNASSSMPGPATGYTDTGTIANVGTANFSPADSEEQIVSATQSSVTVRWKTGGAFDGSSDWGSLADAVAGN